MLPKLESKMESWPVLFCIFYPSIFRRLLTNAIEFLKKDQQDGEISKICFSFLRKNHRAAKEKIQLCIDSTSPSRTSFKKKVRWSFFRLGIAIKSIACATHNAVDQMRLTQSSFCRVYDRCPLTVSRRVGLSYNHAL